MVPHSPVFGRLLLTTQTTPGSGTRILMTQDSTGLIAPMVTLPSNHLMFTYIDILQAYYRARRSGRSTSSILEWEYDYESRCYRLFEELNSGEFQWDMRRAFVTRDPVWREIIVPSFRDRVVHHLLMSYIEPDLERLYIYDVYAGRRGRGVHFAIDRVEHFLRSITRSYTLDGWTLRLDIESFFRSIAHERLITFLDIRVFSHITHPLLRSLIVSHIHISSDRIIRDVRGWGGFPRSKSLFTAPIGYGLPLGDLLSQHLANVYLVQLDHYVKHSLRVRYYGRYMDDMILCAHTRDVLARYEREITDFCRDMLGLSIHPLKTEIRPTRIGVDWLGRRILPYRTYVGPRLKESFIRRATYADESHEGLMSVLGMIGHHDTERLIDRYLHDE